MTDAPHIGLHAVRLGDRKRTGIGWLVVAQGAVRGILSSGSDGEVVHAFACDQRILPKGGLMVFRDLDEAHAWLERCLPCETGTARSSSSTRALDEDIEPRACTRADAERALLAAAVDYCWSIRNRSLPDHGPLRQLWKAFVDLRRLARVAPRIAH